MKRKTLLKRGQVWKSKDSGKSVRVVGKATGNDHWNVVSARHKTHRIHEGTLTKFYTLQNQ